MKKRKYEAWVLEGYNAECAINFCNAYDPVIDILRLIRFLNEKSSEYAYLINLKR